MTWYFKYINSQAKSNHYSQNEWRKKKAAVSVYGSVVNDDDDDDRLVSERNHKYNSTQI